MRSERREAGLRFEKLVKGSNVVSFAGIARHTGVTPQAVNHWKRAGVPMVHAYDVSKMLGCPASDICQVGAESEIALNKAAESISSEKPLRARKSQEQIVSDLIREYSQATVGLPSEMREVLDAALTAIMSAKTHNKPE